MCLPYLPQSQCHDFITPRASDDWESRFESLLELNSPIYWLTPVAGASDFRPGFLSFGYWLQLNALAPWHVHRKWTILVVFNLLRIMPKAILFHGLLPTVAIAFYMLFGRSHFLGAGPFVKKWDLLWRVMRALSSKVLILQFRSFLTRAVSTCYWCVCLMTYVLI